MYQGLFGLAIFASAFLLFFIQPVLAKFMLPIFGGSSFVWIVCLLFFQAALLIGYAYAFLLTKYFSERKQAIIHFILLLGSFYFIPIHFNSSVNIENLWPPLAVLSMLSITILLPFIILSASSPLLQHWYCSLRRTSYPYYYYSISNAGSLLGLLGYPLLLEPFMGTHKQSLLCSAVYFLYAILCILCLRKLLSPKIQINSVQLEHVKLHKSSCAKWLILTFLSSALLLAITQFLTQNVINLPLIWILPLALYLITYIITFATPKGYDRTFWLPTFSIFLSIILWNIYQVRLNGIQPVLILLGLLYSACMVCHGELIRLKPTQKDLTLFYLFIALGGVLGGLFGIAISLILTNWWNFYIPLIIVSAVTIVLSYNFYRQTNRKYDLSIAIFCFLTGAALLIIIWGDAFSPRDKKLLMQHRNLYGFLRVYDYLKPNPELDYRVLMHGTVMHGLEFLTPSKQLWPTTYYGENSGAGLAISFLKDKTALPLQIAVVGLGTGTIAALANPRDNITFYEIDQDVINTAYQYFNFLNRASAKSQIVLGDARIQLAKKLNSTGTSGYDLIVIDAFNGDTIPFHLITQEAMKLYVAHLNPKGIIAFHTSNNYVNLMPVIKALALQQNCDDFWINSHPNASRKITLSTWGVITCDQDFRSWLIKQQGITISPTNNVKPILWTDDYNSILPILRWR